MIYDLIIVVFNYYLLLALGVVALALRLMRLRYSVAVRIPLHFHIARIGAWVLFVMFYLYLLSDVSHGVTYQKTTVALSRMAFISIVFTEIWEQLWILRETIKKRGRI